MMWGGGGPLPTAGVVCGGGYAPPPTPRKVFNLLVKWRILVDPDVQNVPATRMCHHCRLTNK